MTDFGWISSVLGPLGVIGVLLGVFIFFYIDAILFPTLPEVMAILIYNGSPNIPFAIAILVTILLAEVAGLTTLYVIVQKVSIPHRIESAINRYTKFLVVKDEKIILVNRIAPVLPFMGAFAAVCHWDFKKCIRYTLVGGMVKYSLILSASAFFYAYLNSNQAFFVSLAMVITIIIISVIISYVRRDKILGPESTGELCPMDPKK
ncbi:MAG: hypothetical protein A4E32_02011 [Methanomassiliicoccales archaeon PtaU1.Bin124]|nr:MAG: hypothetical protein A4E32_02011 [Methanomassiliicoccales archaeon PtaU1.Bin124]